VSARTGLVVATRNPHKVNEIMAMAGDLFEVRDLSTLPEAADVEETGATFEENARLKALAASARTDQFVLADDSGLEVEALGGAPGVCSARYAGPGADDAANNAKLLGALADTPADRRAARFRCVLVVARNGRVVARFEGTVDGRILTAPRGAHGFGYDPLFVPEGRAHSFAELGPETKNRLSHRARALQQFLTWAKDPL
jgi:XTP/dITP diphosphohydrolase